MSVQSEHTDKGTWPLKVVFGENTNKHTSRKELNNECFDVVVPYFFACGGWNPDLLTSSSDSTQNVHPEDGL